MVLVLEKLGWQIFIQVLWFQWLEKSKWKPNTVGHRIPFTCKVSPCEKKYANKNITEQYLAYTVQLLKVELVYSESRDTQPAIHF